MIKRPFSFVTRMRATWVIAFLLLRNSTNRLDGTCSFFPTEGKGDNKAKLMVGMASLLGLLRKGG